MSKECIDKYIAIEVITNELKKEDLQSYTGKIKDFSTVCACIMVLLIFAGSKEAEKFVDIHEVRVY